MTPNQERIAFLDKQINFGTDGQENFCLYMTKWQIRQYRDSDLRAQPIRHSLKLETFVMT